MYTPGYGGAQEIAFEASIVRLYPCVASPAVGWIAANVGSTAVMACRERDTPFVLPEHVAPA